MSAEIAYRDLNDGEEVEACLMIIDCFNEFIAPAYADVGVMEFLKYVVPDNMKTRMRDGSSVLVAATDDIIIGVIEIHPNNFVTLLFVKKEFHHRGIARHLLELAIEKCGEIPGGSTVLEAISSRFALPIYNKLGFVATDTEQEIKGVKFIPMMLHLQSGAGT